MDNEIESEGPFQLAFFKENDFHRKQCISCKNFFWTQSSDRVTCGDPPCDSYGFIGNPAGKGPLSPDQVRTEFINYFSKDHRYIKPQPGIWDELMDMDIMFIKLREKKLIGEGYSIFDCPNCGENIIGRCRNCREHNTPYTCEKCNFTGP